MINRKLSIVDRIEEQHKFIVEYEGQRYAVREIPFQHDEPQPAEVACVIKLDSNKRVMEIKQDYRPYLLQFYRPMLSYKFRVRADHSTAGYYEVTDDYGFFTRISQCPHLEVGQQVQCRVVKIGDFRLELEFQHVCVDNSVYATQCERINNLCAERGLDKRLVGMLTGEGSDFGDSDTAAASLFGEQVTSLLIEIADAQSGGVEKLNAISEFCLYVLEGSDLLRPLSADDQSRLRERLGLIADTCRVVRRALDIDDNSRGEAVVESVLGRLSLSGYLYNASAELSLVECLMRLRPAIANYCIGSVFSVICKADNAALRSIEPFRSAFIHILENYIRTCRHAIDSADSIEGDDDTQHNIYNAIEALAIQSLLGHGLANPGFDAALNRSLFYRYLSYTKGADTDVLLEKAYRCLTGEWTLTKEFTWDDVNSPLLMAQKAVNVPVTSDITIAPRRYEAQNAVVEITDSVTLHPAETPATVTPQNALPQGLLPWHNLQVRLNENLHIQKWKDESSLRPYQQMWNDIERHIFAPAVTTPVHHEAKKKIPEVGDIVNIRVTRVFNPPYEFEAVVEDDEYEGKGLLSTRDIVLYNPHATLDSFRDFAGRQLLLEARVKSIGEDGRLGFRMVEDIGNAITESDYLNYDDTYDCIVTNYSTEYHSYACISSDGINCFVYETPAMPRLQNGDFIRVKLEERNKRPSGPNRCTFKGLSLKNNFTVGDAFRQLMLWYADEQYWTPEEEPVEDGSLAEVTQADDYMTQRHVSELMMLIDRKAVTTTDYLLAYNYLGMARLMARMLDNDHRADYYSRRMKLLLILQHFEANGSIDSSVLDDFADLENNNVERNKGLYIQFRQLQAVSYLRRPDRNEELWNTVQEAKDPTLARLAKLVLTYNLLGEFKLQSAQKGVHTRINELMNIREKESNLQSFGEEGIHVEFKTSIVFPPDNNMRDDLDRQTRKILEVVCGFLNAEGGTLYLGVNNEGLGVGIENDLKYRYFALESNARDKYDRYIIDSIRLRLGLDAVRCVQGEFIEAAGHSVYRLTLKPCPRLVKFEDGKCIRRVGSESVEFKGEDLRHLEIDRQQELVTMGVVTPAQGTQSAAPVGDEAQATSTAATSAISSANSSKRVPRIATATPQPVATDSYPAAYLYFLTDNTYMLTDEPYRGAARLQLPIVESDATFLVLVYSDGAALRVPTSNLLKCKREQHYSLYRDADSSRDVAFAAIAKADDLLLTRRYDARDRHLTRMDDVERIATSELLNAKGQPLVSVEATLESCDIIPAYSKGTFKKITNLAVTTLGSDLSLKSYIAMHDGLLALGIEN